MHNRDEVYRRFGRLLARRRKKAGLSQEALAKLVGLSRTSIANVERGRQPVQLHSLYTMSSALAIEITDLLPAMPDRIAAFPMDSKHWDKMSPGEKERVARLSTKEKEWFDRIAKPKKTSR